MTSRIHTFRSFLLISCFCLVSWLPTAQAQENQALLKDSLRDMKTVLTVGAVGAVLGLSTLSFVDEPKDNLRNVLIGGALGIILGVGIVAYTQANASKDMYLQNSYRPVEDKAFNTVARTDWHHEQHSQIAVIEEFAHLNYSFSF